MKLLLGLTAAVVVAVAGAASSVNAASSFGTSGLARDPDVAALQVGLRARGVYAGSVDGVGGPATVRGVKALRGTAGVPVDGLVGGKVRRALGRFGKHLLGSRTVGVGSVGWDVAAVQFMLAWHGFPSGPIDGAFGARTERALRKFERWAGLAGDGLVGSSDLTALRQAPPQSPMRLRAPVSVPPTDGFGPRGNRFHTGLDFPAAAGTRVGAAAPGVVTWAGPLGGGWGTSVVVSHGAGLKTLYAHLSAVRAKVGQRVGAGATVGLVGATGNTTGPHLHFEVLLRGAAVDPRPALDG